MGGSELKLEDRLLPQEAGTLDLPTGDIARTIAGVLSVSPRVAVSGDIGAAGGLADLIGFIHASRWTGALRVVDAGTAREIRFLAGEVRAASSNRAADRLGEILFRYGRVSRSELDRGLGRVTDGKRLGQTLIDMGLLNAHDLFLFMKKQVEEIVFSLLPLRSGTYVFERDEENKTSDSGPDLGVSTRQLLFEGARMLDEMQYYRERIPSPYVIPVQRRAAANLVPLGEELRRVLSLVDGLRTVEELGRESQLGEREATRALFQLMQAGHVELKDETETLLADRYGGPRRLVEFVNTFLVTVQETLVACGTPRLLSAQLAHFFSSTSKYSDLFRGIDLDETGHIDEDRIVDNLTRSEAADPMLYLQRGFHELLCFLLFVVGDAVGPQSQKQLSLILLDANRSLDRDNRMWAERARTAPQEVRVVIAGQETTAFLASDGGLEEALSTRDLADLDETELDLPR